MKEYLKSNLHFHVQQAPQYTTMCAMRALDNVHLHTQTINSQKSPGAVSADASEWTLAEDCIQVLE